MGLFKKITKALNPAKAVKNAIKSAGEINAAGFQAVAQGVGAFGGVVKAGTQILRENPELAGLAGGALGMPGLGGAFGGGGGAAPAGEYAAPTPYTQPASPGIPVWVWIAGGGAALVGVVLLMRRKD